MKGRKIFNQLTSEIDVQHSEYNCLHLNLY